MAEAYVGEIRMFGGNFAPVGWMFCEGQLLPIAPYDVLYSLIGITYGGDGVNNFALPDLRGRVPIHRGNGFNVGQMGGAEKVTLTANDIPHSHTMQATSETPSLNTPQNNFLGASANKFYHAGAPTIQLHAQSVGPTGGGQAHDNVQPFQCVSFIICLDGIYPVRP